MDKVSTPFPDVWILEPKVFHDDRGFFLESYSKKKLDKLGFETIFIQENHSKSVQNTVRGLHFQLYPGQVKLVRCSKGSIWDVIVDIRPKSPTFRKWWGIELNEENFKQLYIPVGFAHGFTVLSEVAEVQYKVSSYYDPAIERGIAWDDPSLSVDWHVDTPILSDRDQNNPILDTFLENHPHPFEP